jgi:peptidoglycan/LPS O-acetylase OafA/YrhL
MSFFCNRSLTYRQHHGQFEYDRLLYYPTFARCGPWVIGMTLGFFMYQNREKSHKINKKLSHTLWILSISIMFLVVLGYFPFQQSENYFEFPNILNATYNSLYRSLWAIAVAFIIFACHNGSGGIVKWFLCLPVFQPLTRMSLSIYLSHRFYQIVSIASLKQPVYLEPEALLHTYFGDVVMSLITGTIVYLTIEAPFATLENKLLRRKTG